MLQTLCYGDLYSVNCGVVCVLSCSSISPVCGWCGVLIASVI